jgi:hypothetical protein
MRTMVCVAVFGLVPASAFGQSAVSESVLCGHTVRATHRPDGTNVLEGLSNGSISFGSRTISIEPVHARNGALLVRIQNHAEPDEGLALACTGSALPSVVWRGSLRWRGEDPGERERDELEARDFSGNGFAEMFRVHRLEGVHWCGMGYGIAAIEPLRSETSPATVSPDPAQFLSLEGTAQDTTVASAIPMAPTWNPRTWTRAGSTILSVQFPSSAFELRGVDITASPRLTRRWMLVTETASGENVRYQVTLPEPTTVGRVHRVTLPQPQRVRCMALVASDPGRSTVPPEVTIRSALDDGAAAIPSLVQALDGADGDAAVAMLSSIGALVVDPIVAAMSSMSPLGARRAIRVLSMARSSNVVHAMIAALERDETHEAAAQWFRRNPPGSLDALSAISQTNVRAIVVIASINTTAANKLRAMTPVLGAERDAWLSSKEILFDTLRSAEQEHALDAWIAALPNSMLERSRALEALAETLAATSPTRIITSSLARTLWNNSPDFEARYRLLPALCDDPEGVAILVDVLEHDSDHDLRARAATVLGRSSSSTDVLMRWTFSPMTHGLMFKLPQHGHSQTMLVQHRR